MKRSRFNEKQIVSILKEHEAGLSTREVCRKHGVSEPTFYRWKQKYSGMEVSQVQEMKSLQEEHARLKKLFAELSLENDALKSLIEKKL